MTVQSPAYPAELRKTIAEARSLCADALDEGRDLTGREADIVSAAAAAAKKWQKNQTAVDHLGDVGMHVGTSGGSGAAGRWAGPVLKATSDVYGGVKALISGSATVPSLAGDVVEEGQRASFVRQIVPSRPLAGTDQFSFLRQTVREINAAPVAVGATKPTSTYTMEKRDDRVRTVAHLSEPIPRQHLADVATLQQFVENELRYGLELALDAQIVTGDGTGENFTGILNTPGIQVQPWSNNILTTCRSAVTKLEIQSLTPTHYLLNPADWERVELEQTSGGGDFVFGSAPVDRAARRLWGIQVLPTPAVPAGTGVLGDFRDSAFTVSREQAHIDWSESTFDAVAGASDFQRNMVRFRCEERVGFAITRPLAFCEVDLTAV